MNRYRFHILGLAHIPTSKEYLMCAYTQKIINLIKMLNCLGHETILYCGEGSKTDAHEQVIVVTDADRKRTYGDYDWKKEFFKQDANDEVHILFNKNCISEINKRKQPHDFLLCPMGTEDKIIADAVDLMAVESGIGYTGIFAKYRVFESYAWMHYIYGLTKQDNGSHYDAVIQNYFDPKDFPFDKDISSKNKNYYLFIGRLIRRKGLQIAIETTEKIGAKLIVAGQGNLSDVEGQDFSGYKHVNHIGSITSPMTRTTLYQNAIATFAPTSYIGPFEGVAVESQLCGTPAITTDWGAFAETIKHGITGYRCRTQNEFVWAAINAQDLSRTACRNWAIDNYSIDRVKWKYAHYFDNLYDLWYNGYYTLHDDDTGMDWLNTY